MTSVEILQGKKILLRASGDVSEVIRCARFIPIISGIASEVSLILFDENGLEELIQSAFPDVNVFLSNTSPSFQHDIELDLAKLPLLFINYRHLVSIGYLHPHKDKLLTFKKNVENTGMLSIGLALYGNSSSKTIDSTMISQNITLSQLHNTQFYFIPADPNQSIKKPPHSYFDDTAGLVHDYQDLAALLASLDIIICFENDAAHLAVAMGKPVWLMIPNNVSKKTVDSWKEFSNVTIFQQPSSGDWNEVVRNMSLFRFLQPESIVFKSFSTEGIRLEQPTSLPIPSIVIEETNQLPQILDANLAMFSTVSIETTTVCNLKCPYCPHSTDKAKPPAFMPEEMFYRIIDSLFDYVPSYSGTITPSLYGEPLLDKRFETFIRYTKKKFPGACIELFTNGDFLTYERFISLRESGVDHYNISQHTTERSQALSDTLMMLQKDQSEELPITINRMLVQNKFNRGGLVDVEGYPPELYPRMKYCFAGYQNLTFDYRGYATLCCNDYQAIHTYGNIVSKSVREIWEDKHYRRVRNMMLLGFLPLPICRTCLNH